MLIDKVVVIIVFIGLFVGGFYMANKANQEMNTMAMKDTVNEIDHSEEIV